MKTAIFIAIIGVISMTLALLNGFLNGDFSSDGALLMANPWGIVSLVDLYVGFVLFSLWIAFRETHLAAKVLWITGMMVFGFLTGSLYVLIILIRSKGDLKYVFFGHNTTLFEPQHDEV